MYYIFVSNIKKKGFLIVKKRKRKLNCKIIKKLKYAWEEKI